MVFSPLMVVHDFNIGGLPVLPHEADAIAVADADAVLADAVAFESLQMQTGALKVVNASLR